jgi:hypothetical protein
VARPVKDEDDMFDRSRGPAGKYPWDRWFDGRTWMLTPGEDFDRGVGSFRSVAHLAARNRGGKLRTAVRRGKLYIKFVEGP